MESAFRLYITQRNLVLFQVKKFLVYFRNMITEGMTYEISNLYENTFPKLTDQYFENTSWPEENEVAPIVDNDPVSKQVYVKL